MNNLFRLNDLPFKQLKPLGNNSSIILTGVTQFLKKKKYQSKFFVCFVAFV